MGWISNPPISPFKKGGAFKSKGENVMNPLFQKEGRGEITQ